jgi:hypothetical protein
MRELKKNELPHVHGGMTGPVTQMPQLSRAYWLRNLELDTAINPQLEMHSENEFKIMEVEASLTLLERQPILRD